VGQRLLGQPKTTLGNLPQNAVAEIARRLDARNIAAWGIAVPETRSTIKNIYQQKIERATAAAHTLVRLLEQCFHRLVEFVPPKNAKLEYVLCDFVHETFRPLNIPEPPCRFIGCKFDIRASTKYIVPTLEEDEVVDVDLEIYYLKSKATFILSRFEIKMVQKQDDGSKRSTFSFRSRFGGFYRENGPFEKVPLSFKTWEPHPVVYIATMAVSKDTLVKYDFIYTFYNVPPVRTLSPDAIITIIERAINPSIASRMRAILAEARRRYQSQK